MSLTLPKYSIIIPVYNEQNRLPDALTQLADFYKASRRDGGESLELIFVDDGSSDQTVKIIEQSDIPAKLILQDKNYGKGWAVRRGMLDASGRYRAFLDADMATPVDQLVKLFAALEQGNDVAIGSRITAEGVDMRLVGRKPQSLSRRVLGKAFRLFATRPFLGNIRDSQCGAKAFTAEAAITLFEQQKIKRWSFDIEILYLAKKSRLAVAEVPVDWSAQEDSKLQPSVKLAWSILTELTTIAWIHR